MKSRPVANKSRDSRSLKRRLPVRPPHDRILIVCEGSRTEVNYFNEIRQKFRISGAYLVVTHGNGTQPIQVVDTAIAYFTESPDFEKVYAVFDRDSHTTYHDAIHRAEANASKLRNREKQIAGLEVIASVPSFEVWFLMHYESVTRWEDRAVILHKLRAHLPNYEKGKQGLFGLTERNLHVATGRAIASRRTNGRLPGTAIYTDADKLVLVLLTLVPCHYIGYTAVLTPDVATGTIHGVVTGLKTEITFQAQTFPEIQPTFEASINDYLAKCEARGEKPESPRRA
jgi:RloB-like protein